MKRKVIDKIREREEKLQHEAQKALTQIINDNPELKEEVEKGNISPNLKDWERCESPDGCERN